MEVGARSAIAALVRRELRQAPVLSRLDRTTPQPDQFVAVQQHLADRLVPAHCGDRESIPPHYPAAVKDNAACWQPPVCSNSATRALAFHHQAGDVFGRRARQRAAMGRVAMLSSSAPSPQMPQSCY